MNHELISTSLVGTVEPKLHRRYLEANEAAQVAAYYAKKTGGDYIMIRENSYMTIVWHVAPIDSDLSALAPAEVMAPDGFILFRVTSSGTVWREHRLGTGFA